MRAAPVGEGALQPPDADRTERPINSFLCYRSTPVNFGLQDRKPQPRIEKQEVGGTAALLRPRNALREAFDRAEAVVRPNHRIIDGEQLM
jgi:hypothetical protein